MFGTAVQMILGRMFGQDVYVPPISITGDHKQVETFAKALAGEKKYFDSYIKYGLNDPRTYRNKYEFIIKKFFITNKGNTTKGIWER